MNYISEINAFYIWLTRNPISANAQALWHRLMSYCNTFNWAEHFTITNGRLVEDLNISRQELDRVRNLLCQKGLIGYDKGTGSQCGTYTMLSLVSQKSANPVTQSDTQAGHKPDTNVAQSDTQPGPLNKHKQDINNNPPNPPSGGIGEGISEPPPKPNKNPKKELTEDEKQKLNQIFTNGTAGFTDGLRKKVKEWLEYKQAEKKFNYKPIGLKNLMDEIGAKYGERGEIFVIEGIRRSMANGWAGIFWDEAGREESGQKGNEFEGMIK